MAYDALCTASSSDIKQTCIQLGAQLFRDSYTHLGDNSNTVHGQDFTETALGINMRMIYVEGGMFNMGCTNEQNDCADDEKNVRRVVLDGYYIGMLEVTQSQWEKVMGKNIYKHVDELRDDYSFVVDSSNWEVWVDMFDWVKPGDTVWPSPFCSDGEHLRISAAGPNYPMYLVTWYDAVSFCEKLSEKTGKKYMLPTEAQWEYAARGGNRATGMLYAGSNSIEEVAWYRGNSKDVLHYCGTLLPNALGIYDMSGNVLEWCRDLYSERYLSYDTNNPTGPEKDEGEMYPYYVIRGGDVSSDAKYCRITNRDYCVAQGFNGGIGFRVVCIP